MTLRVRLHPASWAAEFASDRVVRVGRGRANEVRVGHERVHGRWTVSRNHAELSWDGTRWSVLNVSDKPGLLRVYEPGYEEVPLEPGRPWVPVRHRWALSLGRPEQPFHVVCVTDDHAGPAGLLVDPNGGRAEQAADDDSTAALEDVAELTPTQLEREVLLAYYSAFALLPRPAILEPRSHEDAARRLGRTKDSARKAIERINDKISRWPDAPQAASGRNLSAEIGRWLARTGLLDPQERT
ncbi:MAG TPA: FHA domain-containing protein [Acidimicrobiales bacterium]|nr:FHA domain-containing protein [Acidimicrobiales bacterium]